MKPVISALAARIIAGFMMLFTAIPLLMHISGFLRELVRNSTVGQITREYDQTIAAAIPFAAGMALWLLADLVNIGAHRPGPTTDVGAGKDTKQSELP